MTLCANRYVLFDTWYKSATKFSSNITRVHPYLFFFFFFKFSNISKLRIAPCRRVCHQNEYFFAVEIFVGGKLGECKGACVLPEKFWHRPIIGRYCL